MDIIHIIVTLAVIGFIVWAILRWIPMSPPFPNLIIGITVIVTVLWLLQAFGILPLGSLRIR